MRRRERKVDFGIYFKKNEIIQPKMALSRHCEEIPRIISHRGGGGALDLCVIESSFKFKKKRHETQRQFCTRYIYIDL